MVTMHDFTYNSIYTQADIRCNLSNIPITIISLDSTSTVEALTDIHSIHSKYNFSLILITQQINPLSNTGKNTMRRPLGSIKAIYEMSRL